jgi:hypothetical protein
MGNEPNGIPARELPGLLGVRRGGKCRGMKNLILVVAALAFASCGGKQLGGGGGADGSSGSSGNAGSGGSNGGSGAGGSSGSGGGAGVGGNAGAGGSINDSGASFPDVGSPQCETPGGTCVLCSDDKWHCGPVAYAPCPDGAALGSPCNRPNPSCLVCLSSGDAEELNCPSMSGSISRWRSNPFALHCVP